MNCQLLTTKISFKMSIAVMSILGAAACGGRSSHAAGAPAPDAAPASSERKYLLDTIRDAAGHISDVAISYPQDLTAQMLEYSAATRNLRR